MDRTKQEWTERGFTLVETLVCAGLLAALAAGGSHLIARAVQDAESARSRTVATIAAAQKMEQLRALAWDANTDVTADLASEDVASGGSGLSPSPAGTLDGDVAGYVDYLSADGAWLAAAAEAMFARRWAIAAHQGDADTLELRVVVTRARGPLSRTPGRRGFHDVEQASLRTRHQP